MVSVAIRPDGIYPPRPSNTVPALSEGPFVATITGLQVFGTPNPEEWIEYVCGLLRIEERVQWVIGDALLWGERHYPDVFEEFLHETGYQPQTLQHARWVASRIEPQRRRDELAFSMHAAVAALEPDDQDDILEVAILESWTRDEVREEVRRTKGHGRDAWESALQAARQAVRECLAIADTNERIDAVKLAMAALEDAR